MEKKIIGQYVFLALVTATGVLLRMYSAHYYVAGILTGTGGIMLIMVYFGRKVATATAAKIDKRVRDIIVNK